MSTAELCDVIVTTCGVWQRSSCTCSTKPLSTRMYLAWLQACHIITTYACIAAKKTMRLMRLGALCQLPTFKRALLTRMRHFAGKSRWLWLPQQALYCAMSFTRNECYRARCNQSIHSRSTGQVQVVFVVPQWAHKHNTVVLLMHGKAQGSQSDCQPMPDNTLYSKRPCCNSGLQNLTSN